MSVWTHVAATFRIDSFRGLMGLPKANDSTWSEIFGRECLWGADRETREEHFKHPDRFLPCGSEGSLQMSVWNNEDDSSLFSNVVSVFGDLRDFESYDYIQQWFNRCCENAGKQHLGIRQAVCHVEVEGLEPSHKVFVYGCEDRD